jgi:cellulose synthase operon protein C
MAKSMVEKYEQILATDPTSTVFVELARALIERGDNDRALEVCARGCEIHPQSVVGHVLWGKALLSFGRAAEAMKQFDLAVAIDKANPHAYNLIAETLLKKGLYRSAVPILKKAVALQPNEGRVARWLDQTQAALKGGPAPSIEELAAEQPLDERGKPIEQASTSVAQTKSAVRLASKEAPAPARPKAPTRIAPTAAPTVKPAAQQRSQKPGPPVADPDVFAALSQLPPRDEPPTIVGPARIPAPLKAPSSQATLASARPTAPRDNGATHAMLAPVPVAAPASSSNDLPIVAGTPTSDTVSSGLLPVVDATVSDPFDAFGAADPDTVHGLTQTFDALAFAASVPGVAAPALAPNIPVLTPASPDETAAPSASPLWDDVEEDPTRDFLMPPGASALSLPSQGLLDDLPVVSNESQPGFRMPKVEFSAKATEAIALEYEQELRQKLEAKAAKKSFFSRHGLKLAAGAGLLLVCVGFVFSLRYTRASNQGESLQSAVGKGLVALNADTAEQYQVALGFFDTALRMDKSSLEAQVNKALAHAVLYSEYGKQASAKESAQAALTAEARAAFPDFGLVIDALLDEKAGRAALFAAPSPTSKMLAQMGTIRLREKKFDEALKHLSKAVELDPKNVRALVSLGEYYVEFEDWTNAQAIVGGPVATLSPQHTRRVVGLSEARLALQVEPTEALAEFEAMPPQVRVPEDLTARYARVLGLTLSANQKCDAAIAVLKGVTARTPAEAAEINLTLGQVLREGGRMRESQEAYETALSKMPASEVAREGLGRVLLARSREKELLDTLKSDDARKVSLVRGIAWFRLGDFKKARAELSKTEVKGKFPAEAVVYLALADAQEEKGEKSLELLQTLLSKTKRNRATVQVALARLLMQRGALDKAKVLLGEAAKDPTDYEGNTLLAELLLQAQVDHSLALEPLYQAIAHNGSHAPARQLLTRELFRLGKLGEALEQCKAWTLDNAKSEAAAECMATAQWQSGNAKEAVAALALTGKRLDDPAGLRLKANVLFAAGETAAAVKALERANQLNAKDAQTFCEIGFFYLRQSSTEDANAAFAKAKSEQPDSFCSNFGVLLTKPSPKFKTLVTALRGSATDGWQRAQVDATLARVALDERRPKDAQSMAEAVLKDTPGNAWAALVVAEAAHRQKDEAKALEYAQKSVALDASWARARLFLAETLQRAGGDKLPFAAKEFEAVAQLSKDDAEATRAKKAAQVLRKQAN